jgi:hypothetical protein
MRISNLPVKCCGRCKHYEWERHASGRRTMDSAGDCLYVITWPPLPSALIENAPFGRRHMWPDNGGSCECFEATK